MTLHLLVDTNSIWNYSNLFNLALKQFCAGTKLTFSSLGPSYVHVGLETLRSTRYSVNPRVHRISRTKVILTHTEVSRSILNVWYILEYLLLYSWSNFEHPGMVTFWFITFSQFFFLKCLWILRAMQLLSMLFQTEQIAIEFLYSHMHSLNCVTCICKDLYLNFIWYVNHLSVICFFIQFFRNHIFPHLLSEPLVQPAFDISQITRCLLKN